MQKLYDDFLHRQRQRNRETLTSNGTALTGLYRDCGQRNTEMGDQWVRDDDVLPFAETKRQIAAYFAGELTEFTVQIAPPGTAFQQRVWDELKNIPYSTTYSLGDLARRIGQPNSSRAVGKANGRNPISIIIPATALLALPATSRGIAEA